MMIRKQNRFKRRGTAVVETAVILPIGLMFVLGVAEFGHMLNDADFVLNAADRALYDAKRNGRNRACEFRPASDADIQPALASNVN